MRMKDCPCHQDAETPGTARPSRAGRLLILVTVLAAMVLQPGCGRRAPVERLRVRARTLREQKRYDRAATVAELALGIAENSYAPVSLEVAACLTELAAAYEGQGKHAKAEPLYRRALDIHQAVHARPHPDIVRDLNNLSALYQKLGRGEDSETCRKRALGRVRVGDAGVRRGCALRGAGRVPDSRRLQARRLTGKAAVRPGGLILNDPPLPDLSACTHVLRGRVPPHFVASRSAALWSSVKIMARCTSRMSCSPGCIHRA